MSYQRRCGTPMLDEYFRQEALKMEAKLSPEEYRVWLIRRDEPLFRMAHQSWGAPLPPELEQTPNEP